MNFLSFLCTNIFSIHLKKAIYLILPQNRKETYVLLGCILIYFSYSLILALNTQIIQGPPYLSVDTYFSFDNKSIYHYGIQNIEGHPLFQIFTLPIIFIGNLCNYISNLFIDPIKGKVFFILFFCIYLVASSVMYVYRYLYKIIEIKGYILYLLTLIFCFFSTNLVLCFTFESYTYSLFFLSLITYYYGSKIKQNESVSFFSNSLIAITLGGITITNFAKGIIPIFYLKEKPKVIIKRIIIICILFSLLLLITELRYNIIDEIFSRIETFSQTNGTLYERCFDMFFGAPILLPSFFSIDNPPPFPPIIVLDFYHNWWQYIAIGFILFSIIACIILSYKNKLVQILILFICYDIVLHIVVQYGINDAFIYGGHWVFVIPLFLGWLYTKLSSKISYIYITLLSLTCLVIVINNISKLYEFIDLAYKLYPSN